MITDPKTIPAGANGRRVYAVGVGLLATLLIAPQTTEFATKVAILAALAIVCATRGLVELVGPARLTAWRPLAALPRPAAAGAALVGAARVRRLVFAAGHPRAARRHREASSPPEAGRSPRSSWPTRRAWPRSSASAAQTIARNVLADLRIESDALRRRDLDRAAAAAERRVARVTLGGRSGRAGAETTVASYDVDRMVLTLQRGAYQGPPSVVANLQGTYVASTYGRTEAALVSREPVRFRRTVELLLDGRTYRIVRSEGGLPLGRSAGSAASGTLGGTTFVDVANTSRAGLPPGRVPLRRLERHDRDDGRRPLLARLRLATAGSTCSSSTRTRRPTSPTWEENGGLPRSALFHNVGGPVRGREPQRRRRSAAARKRLRRSRLRRRRPHRSLRHDRRLQRPDGHVRRAALERRRRDVHRGRAGGRDRRTRMACGRDGRRRQRRRPSGSVRRRRTRIPTRSCSRPPDSRRTTWRVRDLLYLNEGTDSDGHSTFRDVARAAGIERSQVGHGLGAVFTDYDGDGRPRPVRGERRRPEPALPERRRRWPDAARLPLRGGRATRRTSPIRTQAWGSPRRTSTATGGPISS